MNYRNVFIEFLYEFKEYFYNFVQLVVLEKDNKDDLNNYFHKLEEIEVFQAKGMQVYYKKRHFNDIQNTLVEMALINDDARIYELDELKYLNDVYTTTSLNSNTSKFVFVKPIFLNESVKAVFLVFSDIRTEWMISDKKILSLCSALQASLHQEQYNEIDALCNTKYWRVVGDKSYLSDELKKLLLVDSNIYSGSIEGHYLFEIGKQDYCNNTLVSYEINNTLDIKSLYELFNTSLDQYSLIYIESNENVEFEDFYSKILEVLKEIDGQLGKYNIFQIDKGHIALVYNKVIVKKVIEDYFKEFNYIIVRSGYELKQKVDFKMLIEYLNLSPIEQFNQEYYKYFCDNYNKEQVNRVINNNSNSKIMIIPVFDSLYSKKVGYMIKDTGNIELFDKNTKQKSIMSLFKVINEYKNELLFVELPILYFYENQKLSLGILNKVKKQINSLDNNCFIVTNYSNQLNKIYAHWPEINKYLYFYDIPDNLYNTILSLKSCNGIYFNSEDYRRFFDSNNIAASSFLKFVINDSKKVLIKVKKTDIIKYQQENLLLVCE